MCYNGGSHPCFFIPGWATGAWVSHKMGLMYSMQVDVLNIITLGVLQGQAWNFPFGSEDNSTGKQED